MAEYVYSRVSTDRQDTENQLARLRELYPNAVVYEEVASGAKQRPVLQELLSKLQSGDTLVTYALDRLGRKTSEVLLLIEDLDRRGVALKTVREGVDVKTIAGRLVLSIIASVSQMEREVLIDRTKVALAARKRAGVKLGRKYAYQGEVIERIKTLGSQGNTVREIAALTGVSKSTVARVLSQDRAAEQKLSA